MPSVLVERMQTHMELEKPYQVPGRMPMLAQLHYHAPIGNTTCMWYMIKSCTCIYMFTCK